MDVLPDVKESDMIEFYDIEGYYWLADEDTPRIVGLDAPCDWEWESSAELPKNGSYMVAAFLCRYKGGKPSTSIHIRFVDGEYICEETDLPESETPQCFMGVKGLPKLRFVQLWDKEQREYDEETFDTLVPGKSLFAGFVKDNK